MFTTLQRRFGKGAAGPGKASDKSVLMDLFEQCRDKGRLNLLEGRS